VHARDLQVAAPLAVARRTFSAARVRELARSAAPSYPQFVLTFWGLADYEVNEILEVFADCEDAEKMLRECLSERAGVGRDLGELEAASAVWPHRGSPPRGSKKGLPRQGARQRAVEVSGERERSTASAAQRPYRPSAVLT